MIIGGFWHGAKWTFIIWGILHGIGLVLHKILNRYNLIKFLSNKYLNIFLTFNYISFLWIFFRAVDTKNAIISINKILFETNLKEIPAFYLARKETILFLLISTVIIFSKNLYKNRINLIFHKMPIWMIGFLMIAFLQIILQLKDNLVEPFIYFQF
jgi:D-alanyl-lipoteichoic acid acyltransferase DltB (MBOAT superfamily)